MRNRIPFCLAPLIASIFVACGSSDSPARPAPEGPPPGQATIEVPTREPIDTPRAAARALFNGRYVESAEAFRSFAGTFDNPEQRAYAHLQAAVALHEAGDPPAAIETLEDALDAAPADSDTARRAAYLLARILSTQQRHDEAATVLAPFHQQPRDDHFQPHLDHAFASASATAGDREAATSAWDTALEREHVPPRLRAIIAGERAAIARVADDLEEAAHWLELQLEAEPGAATRSALAEVSRELGDDEAWRTQLHLLIEDHAGSPVALTAVQELQRHGIYPPRAAEAYVYYRHGRYAEARQLFARSLQEDGLEPADTAFRLFYLAAALEDDGQNTESIAVYDAAIEADPGSPLVHDAYYWSAVAASRIGEPREASARYLAAVESDPGGEYATESAYQAGNVLRQAGEPARAVRAWNELKSIDSARILYWKARAAGDAGDSAAAEDAFQRAYEAEPLSFYGREAARHLGDDIDNWPAYRPLESPPPPDWDTISAWAGEMDAAPPAAGAAADFAAIGFRTEAASALEDLDLPLLGHLRAAYELGLTSTATTAALEVIEESGDHVTGIPADLLRLAYPAHHPGLLNEFSAQHAIDPLFIAAVIHAESTWNPGAESHAGALGLAQVMPATGDAIAGVLGHDNFNHADLLRPIVSVEYGATYLAEQLDTFENPYLAIAAYNAGPGNAARWHDLAPDAVPADLVEVIDFDETATYVPRVMSRYARYRYAHGQAD